MKLLHWLVFVSILLLAAAVFLFWTSSPSKHSSASLAPGSSRGRALEAVGEDSARPLSSSDKAERAVVPASASQEELASEGDDAAVNEDRLIAGGRVVDATGEPIAKVMITLFGQGDGELQSRNRDETDEQGRFEFWDRSFPEGKVRLRVDDEFLFKDIDGIEQGTQNLEISFHRKWRLRLNIADAETGAPIVSKCLLANPFFPQVSFSARLEPDTSGMSSIELPEGTFRLSVEARDDGYPRHILSDVRVGSGMRREPIGVPMHRGARVLFTFLVEGGSVPYQHRIVLTPLGAPELGSDGNAAIDPVKGEAEIVGPEPGKHAVTVVSGNGERFTKIELIDPREIVIPESGLFPVTVRCRYKPEPPDGE